MREEGCLGNAKVGEDVGENLAGWLSQGAVKPRFVDLPLTPLI